ncbi:hypothetical protein ACFSC6_06440 [Rufibacter sediminis]|uniref:Tissue inhibitor of metalloproteinase n=1 Tax=Rufibacter sediminis TaxID=2762756 RepID=A0ABR6VN49_9BACT|nr:hypothetical protein [Rufibacter sediminis]MBC3538587.1 hypothetical protein [Rufibacter sediminis]
MRIVLLLLFTLSINTAIACSCAGSTIFENFKGSDVVFKGKVIDVKEVKTKEKTTSGQTVDYKRYEFKFEIKNRYKGLKSKEPVTIITTGGGSDCGNYFDLGKSYIVYAYKEDMMLSFSLMDRKTDENLSTNLCTRTKQAYPWTFLESLVLDIL